MLSYPNYRFIKETEVSKDDIEKLVSKDTASLGLILDSKNLTIINKGDLTLEKSIIKDGLNRISYLNPNSKSMSINSKTVDVDKFLSPQPKMFLSVFCGMSFFYCYITWKFIFKKKGTFNGKETQCMQPF